MKSITIEMEDWEKQLEQIKANGRANEREEEDDWEIERRSQT